jgi:hypothetical protein
MTIIDEITQSGLDVSSYTLRSQMRKNATTVANTTILMSKLDAANGRVSMGLSSANTALLTENRYSYDIELVSPLNIVTRIAEGIITISPNITR